MRDLNKLMKLLFILPFITLSFFGHAQFDTIGQITKYVNESYNVQYPASWTIDTSKKLGADFFIFSPKENDSDKFRENVNLIVQDLSGQNIDLDKYAQISEGQIKELATDGKIYESKKITTAKTEYYKIIYSMTQSVFKLKIEQYYLVKNDKAFVITFSSEFDKFDVFKIVGEEILNSFTLTK